jgi:hypothetical protein
VAPLEHCGKAVQQALCRIGLALVSCTPQHSWPARLQEAVQQVQLQLPAAGQPAPRQQVPLPQKLAALAKLVLLVAP